MTRASVLEAELLLGGDCDEAAVGAAVTVELCGTWDHSGPCPVAPHHTAAARQGDELHVRVLFAVPAGQERVVRDRVVAALSSGSLARPDGPTSRWRLLRHSVGELRPEEQEHAARLAHAPGPATR